MKSTLGWVNSTVCLHVVFMCADPKSEKKQSRHQCLFALLGSACSKAAHKTLVKSTLGWVNSTVCLHVVFTCADPKSEKNSQVISVFLYFWDLRVQKLLTKLWRNRPLVGSTLNSTVCSITK